MKTWRCGIRLVEAQASTMLPDLRVVFDAIEEPGRPEVTYTLGVDFSPYSDSNTLRRGSTMIASGTYDEVCATLSPILQRCDDGLTVDGFVMYAMGYADGTH